MVTRTERPLSARPSSTFFVSLCMRPGAALAALSLSHTRQFAIRAGHRLRPLVSTPLRSAALTSHSQLIHFRNMASRSFATAVDAVQGSSSSHLLPPSLAHLDSSKRPDGYVEASDANQRQWIVFSREIEKSESDDRQYRCGLLCLAPRCSLPELPHSIIRLKNGLEAVLISDPSTDKAAAALSVRVGHLSDPVRAPFLKKASADMLAGGTARPGAFLVRSHACVWGRLLVLMTYSEHLLFMGTKKVRTKLLNASFPVDTRTVPSRE